ncbi:hypothetical protein M431DRAFT_388533 [Trichoderma harzianum CBS 226.95]|uniref:Uncharacterized protein n=1 Tax=Trichoderma harzianum CBS 226.95 TaxID=983964 RepID=A0A2T4AIL5_TRIHA|nr:hypothetical protein M431DRAFT_388533 [Trichoderma harzianum CBS 226.95]PTB56882.1 hypothetical protein M431DRAFT_388533 [Trichoderma harzianum CBS 226.95]
MSGAGYSAVHRLGFSFGASPFWALQTRPVSLARAEGPVGAKYAVLGWLPGRWCWLWRACRYSQRRPQVLRTPCAAWQGQCTDRGTQRYLVSADRGRVVDSIHLLLNLHSLTSFSPPACHSDSPLAATHQGLCAAR